jgi:transcriptional regulator with XRE-family HTH domain
VEAEGIGHKIRFHRQRQGLTQTELADRIGVSYQQIQKYEANKNQITLQRLFLIAKALDTPVQAFIAELNSREMSDASGPDTAAEQDSGRTLREERALLRLFARIQSPHVKRTILKLVESIVEQQAAE